jgi:hypothetical protein
MLPASLKIHQLRLPSRGQILYAFDLIEHDGEDLRNLGESDE